MIRHPLLLLSIARWARHASAAHTPTHARCPRHRYRRGDLLRINQTTDREYYLRSTP